jgi:hypothetical protein
MIKRASQLIQAFPVTSRTFSGVANNYTAGGSVIHAAQDTDITFTFKDGTSLVLSAKQGMDFAIGDDVESITSTAQVWIS